MEVLQFAPSGLLKLPGLFVIRKWALNKQPTVPRKNRICVLQKYLFQFLPPLTFFVVEFEDVVTLVLVTIWLSLSLAL